MIFISVIEWIFHVAWGVICFLLEYVLPDLAFSVSGRPAKKPGRSL